MRFTAACSLIAAVCIQCSAAAADSIGDIYELALENDALIKAQEAQYRAASEARNLGRAALLPQVSGNYEYTETDRETAAKGINFSSGTGDVEVIDTFNDRELDRDGYQVSLSQALFDLPAWFNFQSGKELSKEAEATFAANQQDLILRVVQAYLAVLRARDNLEASRAQERALERQLDQTRQRFEVGLIAITDVNEAQAAFDLARVNRIVDENNVSVALEQLSVLTGRNHSNLHVLEDSFETREPEPNDRSAWVDFALENNFQLQAARYAEEAARQSARASRMEHVPSVTGNINYSDYSTDGTLDSDPPTAFDVPPDSDEETTVWSIRLEVPLFSGGAVSAERRRAAQEFIAARENRINLMRNTVTDARSLHMTVNSDIARVAARKQSIVSSRSALDATQAGYEVGTRNIVDVLNAQNALYAAQRDYANSRYDYIIDMLQLKREAGLLSPEDVYRLDSQLEPPPAPTATESE